jgi:thiamine transport system substrate-binding protein
MTKRILAALLPLTLALALAPAAQAEPPVLTVYTYSSFAGEYGPGAAVKARFEEGCACTLDWVESDDAGTLLARLKLEGAATKADVVLGLDTNLMTEAKASGLFAAHAIDPGKLDLPIAWSDDTFLPFDWGWFAFVYDSSKLTAPPASLKDLVESPDGPTIVIQDPRTSTPGLGLLLWMREIYGDGAADAWRKLAPKVVTVTQGWSDAYGLFLKGEADMVLSYQTSPAYHLIAEKEAKYKAAIFSEGHVLQVEVAAMTAATDTPDLARSFLTFMLSERFQSAIPEGNWMHPAKLAPESLPQIFRDLPRPETSLFPAPEAVGAARRAWIDEWLSAMSR